MLNRCLLYFSKVLKRWFYPENWLPQVFVVAFCSYHCKYIFRLQLIKHRRLSFMITSRILTCVWKGMFRYQQQITMWWHMCTTGFSLVCDHTLIDDVQVQGSSAALGFGSLIPSASALWPSLVHLATPPYSESTWECNRVTVSFTSMLPLCLRLFFYPLCPAQGLAHSKCSIKSHCMREHQWREGL